MTTENTTITLPDGSDVEEQKSLGLPEGSDIPTSKQLNKLMRELGYDITSRATKPEMYATILARGKGQTTLRAALHKAVREQLGIEPATEKAQATSTGESATRLDDDEVKQLIVEMVAADTEGELSSTAKALKQFRSLGHSCSQARFRSLYELVKSTGDTSESEAA